jgi:hypothetical protein
MGAGLERGRREVKHMHDPDDREHEPSGAADAFEGAPVAPLRDYYNDPKHGLGRLLKTLPALRTLDDPELRRRLPEIDPELKHTHALCKRAWSLRKEADRRLLLEWVESAVGAFLEHDGWGEPWEPQDAAACLHAVQDFIKGWSRQRTRRVGNRLLLTLIGVLAQRRALSDRDALRILRQGAAAKRRARSVQIEGAGLRLLSSGKLTTAQFVEALEPWRSRLNGVEEANERHQVRVGELEHDVEGLREALDRANVLADERAATIDSLQKDFEFERIRASQERAGLKKQLLQFLESRALALIGVALEACQDDRPRVDVAREKLEILKDTLTKECLWLQSSE